MDGFSQHGWQLERRIRERRVVPWVGAGVSASCGLPDWDSLLSRLEQACGIPPWPAGHRPDPAWRAELIHSSSQMALVDLVRKVCPELGAPTKKPTSTHRLLATGPWAAILTPNWDPLLEQAWAEEAHADEQRTGEVAKLPHLPPRYRAEAQLFTAELRAGLRPARILKLHGDLSEEGGSELVLSHRDYRRVVVREPDTRALLTFLLSEYSLLFYGTSLRDPDLLGILDEVYESLGHAIGPHFWIVDHVAPRERALLDRVYGIKVLDTGVVGAWAEVEHRLSEVIRLATSPTLHRARWGGQIGGIRVELLDSFLPANPPKGSISVASLAIRRNNLGFIGGGTAKALGIMPSELQNLGPVQAGTACALPDRPQIWVAFGQHKGGYGRRHLVHQAIRDLVEKAVQAEILTVHLPLLAASGGGLDRRTSLLTSLHALGAAARILASQGKQLTVYLHLPPEGTQEDVLASVMDGQIRPAEALHCGFNGVSDVTVIYQNRRPGENSRWQLRTVRLPDDLAIAALRNVLADAVLPEGKLIVESWQRMQRFEEIEETASILSAGLTHGASVILHPSLPIKTVLPISG